MRTARQADSVSVAKRAGKVDDDKWDVVGELRAAGGGATARDEAGAAAVKPLSDMVSAGYSSVDPKCFTVRICNIV